MNKDKELPKTKEEVLKQHISLYFSSHHDKSRWNGEGEHGGAEWHAHKPIAEDIYKAMDEYANLKAQPFIQCIEKLADWNKKYPPGRIYGYEMAATLEGELTEIVNQGIAALSTYREGIDKPENK